LKGLRADADLSGEALGRRAGMSQSKVSRIESGRLTPSVADVEALADALQLPATVKAELVDQASAVLTEVHSWRALHGPGFRKHQEELRQVERDATDVRQFNPVTIPGLMQTPAYCRHVLEVSRMVRPDDLTDAVASRMERQAVLYDEAKSFRFVVTEAALRWRLCPPNVHVEQLARLETLSSFGNIRLGVIALDAYVPAVPLNQFVLFDDQLVTVETFGAELKLEERGQLDFYRSQFDTLDSLAAHDDEARTLLSGIVRRLNT
jgi:transcriptional regulator with XRE-family HTH domain